MSTTTFICSLCSRPILSETGMRSCSSCQKLLHLECDLDAALSSNGVENEYVCPSCRNSPLVADAMMTSAGNSSVAASPTSISTHDDLSRSAQLDGVSYSSMINSPSNRAGSPLLALSHLDSTFNDIFSIANPSEQTPTSPTVILTSSNIASTSSTTDISPIGFADFSTRHDMDEFRTSAIRRDRIEICATAVISSAIRGSRGGSGIKKPIINRGMAPRTRSLGGTAESMEIAHSCRGKRGGRGGNKNGRGRRPRGGKTSAMLAMVNVAAANAMSARDVEPEGSEADDARQKSEGDNDYLRTVVVTCIDNLYFISAPLCLVCGSIGKSVEGTMVTCVTCAQSFHTYCVGLHHKLNSTTVKRGWRCLDCTVCEGCGNGHDEPNLLLCDECDISYHIYCLDPPLERIPQGSWRCRWCSACRRCGMQIGIGVDTQRMDGLCGACFSLKRCPKCARVYDVGDYIVKCQHCSRWMHGKCEELYNEEMLETASESGFRCSQCRPSSNFNDAYSVLICDNVALNKCSIDVLHSRYGSSLYRCPPYNDSTNDFPSYIMAPKTFIEDSVDDDDSDSIGFGMGGRGRGMRSGGPNRRVLKLGVGGFFVKIPRHRLMTTEEEQNVDDDIHGQKPKLKRPRKPRRSQLEDNYPPVIQESFFGMRPVEGRCLLDVVVDEPHLHHEYFKSSIMFQKRKDAREVTEIDAEAYREGDNVLGNITENDILDNMEEIDLDNLDFNDLLMDDDDNEDDDAMDCSFNYKFDPEEMRTSGGSQNALMRPQIYQQGLRYPGRPDSNSMMGIRQGGPVLMQGFNQPSVHTQSSSRSSSQLGDACTERVNQATEKWEEDEPLGDRATKAAVLYTNLNYPEWKQQYPEWCERVKHIHRMWRSLDANSRQEYVNKARENRANRVKQPRVKRAATTPTGIVRAIVGQNRYGTQTNQGDAGFAQVEVTNAFGANTQQGINLPSGTCNPQALIANLGKDLLDNYSLMQKRSGELVKYQLSIENDLARMRKQKKNLTAKRRQLNKNNQQVDCHGRRVDVELNDVDRCALSNLINSIPVRQKDLENCKRDIKVHTTSLRDFELKHHIPPELISQMTPVVQPVVQTTGGPRPAVPSGQNAVVLTNNIRPPPSYPAFGVQGNYRPSIQPGINPSAVDQSHQQFIVTGNEGPVSPTPTGGIIGSSSSMELHNRGSKMAKRRRREEISDVQLRQSLLGHCLSSIERDVFDILDSVVTQVVIKVDGAEAARKSGMLKRLLESNLGKNFQSQTFSNYDCDGQPKPKKKRTQQKKVAVATANEYELLLERISTQLRLCPPLPRRALEPISRIDRSTYPMFGVTNLPQRIDKPSTVGDSIGNIRLVFMNDYYTRMFEPEFDDNQFYCSMSDFSTDAKMSLLYRTRSFSPTFAWREDHEVELPMSKMRALSVARRSNSPPLRIVSRITESFVPQTPSRYSFSKVKQPQNMRVEIVFEGLEGTFDAEANIKQLLALLNIPPFVEYHFDTPPRTPESVKQEHAEACKMENGARIDTFTCCSCNARMEHPIMPQQTKQFGAHEKENENQAFCTLSCYYNHMARIKAALSPDDLSRAKRYVDDETLNKLRQISADNFAKSLQQSGGQSRSPSSTSISSPLYDIHFSNESDAKNNIQVVHARELSIANEAAISKVLEKKWKGQLWMQYDSVLLESFQQLTNKVRQEHMEIELQSAMRTQGVTSADDKRTCAFCRTSGDGEIGVCGRLINADANSWVHVNCALWSEEVYENSSGALMNVDDALRRAANIACSLCSKLGASLRCYKLNCERHFHISCAKNTSGKFMKDKTFICELHEDYRPDMVLERLDALRRIFVEREENQVIAKLFHSEADRMLLRVGSLIFLHIGQLLPEQLKTFHSSDYIFPIGYSVKRMFWSPFKVNERIQYTCTIAERNHSPEFVITYEGGYEHRDSTASAAWSHILKMVEAVRNNDDNMLRLFYSNLSGEGLFGLSEAAVSKMTESLPGVDQLLTYTFKHGGSPLMDLPLAVNPSGCARCEPRFRTLIKHKHRRNQPAVAASARTNDLLLKESRTRGSIIASSIEPCSSRSPYPADSNNPYSRWEPGQLGNTYYTQYQKMKKEWTNTVYLARSRIQGLGLYASRDIEMNSMIIEYKGEVIRSEVGEMREKRYEAQNRGVYMFRIDDEKLIDATMAGGPARYINHSCDPNCSTRLVSSGPNGEEKKIIIIANRPISAGEELTYDYQFDIEDTEDKIPCLCGAPNCQKWMN